MLHPAEDALSAYLDGELPSGEAQAVRAHLARCPGCSATAGLFSGLERTLALGDPGCAAVSTLLSAARDGELVGEERSIVAAHVGSCVACEARQGAWSGLDTSLAALPAGLPSERVDRAIARLVAPRTRRVPRVAWPTGAAAALAALLIALVASLPAAGPAAPQAALPEQAFVAAIQQSVLDPRTNTLYVLRPERGVVSVVDASSNVERATVPVGGRPTALALNALSNTIVVLDAGSKMLTEIDTSSNAIVGATAIAMSGTPTSVQVDGKGKIIVTTIVPPTTTAAPLSTPNVSTGQVGVFDPSTKRLEAVRRLEIAPRLVVLDATAARALFVAADVTTLVEADTYRVIGTLPGGIAAAFGARDAIAVLAAADGQAALIVSGAQPHRIALNGEPLAVIALPDGTFAALTAVGGRGVITLVAPSGTVMTTIDVANPGAGLTYDASSRRFAVSAPEGVSFAALPIAAAGPPPVVVETPRPTRPPAAVPPVAATAPPVAPAASAPSPGAPVPGAQHAFGETYRLDGARAAVIAGTGATLWLVDQNNGLKALDTASGAIREVAQLPLGSTASALEVSPGYVFVPDVRAARLHILRISDGYLATVPIPFLRSATAFATGRDDRLWLGTREGTLLRWDPRAQRLESFDLRNTMPIVALAADDAGRIWAATRGSSTLLSYDTLASRLGGTALGTVGSVAALAGDGAGTVWAGTDQGELLALRNGQAAAIGSIGRPIGDLVADAAGRGWYAAPGGLDLVISRLDGAVSPLRVPPLLQGLSFDVQGRAWQVDPGTGSLYVTRVTGR